MVLHDDTPDLFWQTAAARAGETLEIDEATYRDYESMDDISRYPYALLFVDGSTRVCAFAHLVGDDEVHPYLGFWSEGDRFYCKRLVDRLVDPEDGGNPYLPPLAGSAPIMTLRPAIVIPIVSLLLLAACGQYTPAAQVTNSSGEPIQSVTITLFRDGESAPFKTVRTPSLDVGGSASIRYTISGEYYMRVSATLSSGRTLTNDYAYVIDDAWRPARQTIDVGRDIILVNGEPPPKAQSSTAPRL